MNILWIEAEPNLCYSQVMAVVTENPAEGAFQLYTIANKEAVSPIPDSLDFEHAAVLPLAVSTATVGLYTPQQLALPLPTLKAEPKNQVVLVWGGSSSVGGMTIQFAKLSGYKVAATCSPRNNDYVKSLGADFVFDYSSPSIVDDIVNGLKDYEVAGIFNAIGGNIRNCMQWCHFKSEDTYISTTRRYRTSSAERHPSRRDSRSAGISCNNVL